MSEIKIVKENRGIIPGFSMHNRNQFSARHCVPGIPLNCAFSGG